MDLPFYRRSSDSSPAGLVPISPGKIICVGRNYRAHARELGNEVPSEPLIFFKASSGLIGAGDAIVRPSGFERVDFEGEIGVVIGKTGRRIRAADALTHVLGYTCMNDLTIRDLQKRDKQWWRAKGFDTSCAVGPRVVADLDHGALAVITRVNGDERQRAPASQMAFSIEHIIEFASELMTLEEGDLIATGTPAGVGNLNPGDRVEVEVVGVGVLENPVIAEERQG